VVEFDHADIFTDLNAIETQFHHLVRTVPGDGLILANGHEDRHLKKSTAREFARRRKIPSGAACTYFEKSLEDTRKFKEKTPNVTLYTVRGFNTFDEYLLDLKRKTGCK